METNKISELAKILKENNLTRIELTEGNMHVVLEADAKFHSVDTVSSCINDINNKVINREITENSNKEEFSREIATKEAKEVKSYDHIQNAPLVGTVYVANKPDEPPLVTVGQKIKKGDAICIIESMKMFNAIEADIDGFVAEIFIENGQIVEFGQNLIAISKEV